MAHGSLLWNADCIINGKYAGSPLTWRIRTDPTHEASVGFLKKSDHAFGETWPLPLHLTLSQEVKSCAHLSDCITPSPAAQPYSERSFCLA